MRPAGPRVRRAPPRARPACAAPLQNLVPIHLGEGSPRRAHEELGTGGRRARLALRMSGQQSERGGATRRHSCARARGPANPFSRATSRAIPVSDHRRSGSGFAPRAEACRSLRTNRRPSHSESWDDESHRPESEDAESPLLDDDAWPVDSLVGSSSGRAPSPRQRSLWAAFSSSKRFRRRRALARRLGRCCDATLSSRCGSTPQLRINLHNRGA